MPAIGEEFVSKMSAYCEREVFQKGTKPLKEGVEIAITIDGAGPITLLRKDGRSVIVASAPKKADLTVDLKARSLETLTEQKTEDVGEIGIQIVKLMMSAEPTEKIAVKVHIGVFDFVFHGYLGILPLGGPTFMKFLGEKGFSSLSKIKEVISSLRSSR